MSDAPHTFSTSSDVAIYAYEQAMEVVEKLKRYTSLECDSQQEAIDALCDLLHYPDYVDDETWEALVDEANRQLKNYEENCKIVKTIETFTRESEELVWKWEE